MLSNPLMNDELNEAQSVGGDDTFKVTDLGSLSWVLRKIKAIIQKEEEVRRVVQDEIARLEEWETNELKKYENSRAFFEGKVLEYCLNERASDPKFKSTSTPYGRVTLKKQVPEYRYDEQKLLRFLEDNQYIEMIKVEKKPAKAEVKKFFAVSGGKLVDQATGAIVEGVEIIEREEKLDIKVE